MKALRNAQLSGADLKKCSLYVTRPPCLQCTKVILKAGISTVIYGAVAGVNLDNDTIQMVYNQKACYK